MNLDRSISLHVELVTSKCESLSLLLLPFVMHQLQPKNVLWKTRFPRILLQRFQLKWVYPERFNIQYGIFIVSQQKISPTENLLKPSIKDFKQKIIDQSSDDENKRNLTLIVDEVRVNPKQIETSSEPYKKYDQT